MPKYHGDDTAKPGRERQVRKARRDLERVSKTLAGSVWTKRNGGADRFVERMTGAHYALINPAHRHAARCAPRYPMEIAWSDEDRAYVVTVPDLPGCMTHGATYAEAAERGENAIAMWLRAARHWGTPIPLPGLARKR